MAEDSSLRELVEGAGVGMVLGIIGMGLAFVFNVFAARYYGPDAFGQFTLAKTILLFTSMVAGMGIIKGVERYIPRYESNDEGEKLKGYLSFVFTWPISLSVMLGLGLFFSAEWLTGFFDYPSEFSTLLRVVGLTVPFRVLQQVFTRIFLAHKNVFLHQFNTEVVENVVLLAGMAVVVWFDLSVFALVVTLALSFVIASLFNWVRYRWDISHSSIDGSESGDHQHVEWLQFSVPLFFTGVLGFVVNWTDNFFIGRYLEPEQLGVYGVVFSMAMVLKLFQVVFMQVFKPILSEKVAEEDFEGIRFLFKKSAAWIFALTLPVFLVFFMYAKEVLRLVYGQAYMTGFIPLMILSAGFLITVGIGLVGPVLYAHGESQEILYTNVVAALANVALNYFLVSWYGIIGASIASALTLVLQEVAALFFAWRRQALRYDWAYMSKFVIAGLPAAFFGARLFRLDLWLPLTAILSLVVYGGLYAMLLLLLRTFDEDDVLIIDMLERKTGYSLTILKQVIRLFK
jgi:O-antigen/teichoic acid export membrane protein